MKRFFFEDFFKYLKNLIKQLGLPEWMEHNFTIIVSLLIFLVSIISGLRKIVLKISERRRNKILDLDLHPFFTHKSVMELNENYIKTRLLGFTPSNYEELLYVLKILDNKNTISFQQFYEEMRDDDNEQRFYFILGESGLGKTTFLMNLFFKYNKSSRKKYKIKLIPLGNPFAISEIEKLIPIANNTILLIDGFDEFSIIKSQKQDLNDMFSLFWRFRRTIISCRTQFFENQETEPNLTPLPKAASTGFETYKKYYVSPLTENEVKKFLRKKIQYIPLQKQKPGKANSFFGNEFNGKALSFEKYRLLIKQ